MNIDKLKVGNEIQEKIVEFKMELLVWRNKLTEPSLLGYSVGVTAFDNGIVKKLNSNMPLELFNQFRSEVIEYLNERIEELEQEFEEL